MLIDCYTSAVSCMKQTQAESATAAFDAIMLWWALSGDVVVFGTAGCKQRVLWSKLPLVYCGHSSRIYGTGVRALEE